VRRRRPGSDDATAGSLSTDLGPFVEPAARDVVDAYEYVDTEQTVGNVVITVA
jgi:hypothetical protein